MLQELSQFLEILDFCRVGKLNQLRGQGITELLGNLYPKTHFILLKQGPGKQLIWEGKRH